LDGNPLAYAFIIFFFLQNINVLSGSNAPLIEVKNIAIIYKIGMQ
jgi:hypothetical protein